MLIEVKRDVQDIIGRKEALESQAVRYAASLATIKDVNELVEKVFANYINKHAKEFDLGFLTPEELGRRIINAFLKDNGADKTFNKHQSILLVASSFDAQTRSASAWLSENGIDIQCIALHPIRCGGPNGQLFLSIERSIPLPKVAEVLIGFPVPGITSIPGEANMSSGTRAHLPRMAKKLFEWGIVKHGDILRIKNVEGSEAEAIDPKNVRYKGAVLNYNEWGRAATKWSSICIYEWILTSKDVTLAQLRAERMKEEATKATAEAA